MSEGELGVPQPAKFLANTLNSYSLYGSSPSAGRVGWCCGVVLVVLLLLGIELLAR